MQQIPEKLITKNCKNHRKLNLFYNCNFTATGFETTKIHIVENEQLRFKNFYFFPNGDLSLVFKKKFPLELVGTA
jgi:hypothetical protein